MSTDGESVEIFPGFTIEKYVPPPVAEPVPAPFAQEHVPAADFKKVRHARTAAAPAALEKLPPHSIEAEQGVLGCMFLDPVESIGKCIETLKAGAQCFYDLRHRALYECLIEFHRDSKPIDLITVQQRLKDQQKLEEIGGLAYLSSLMDAVPSASNLAYYLSILREKHLLRRLLQTATAVVGKIHEHEDGADPLIDWVDSEFANIRRGDLPGNRVTMQESMQLAFDRYNAALAGNGDNGIDTGLYSLRKFIRGFQKKHLILIAGRPSSGKSSMATSILINQAIILKASGSGKAALFTFETPRDDAIDRCVQSLAGVSLRDINQFNDEEQRALVVGAGRLNELPILIEDDRLNIDQLRARIRDMVLKEDVRVVFVDYAEKVVSTLHPATPGRDRLKQISDVLKETAKEFSIPIVLLCQMNREVEKLNRKPILADLAESGALEKEADEVIMLAKPKADLMEKDTVEIAAWVEKNRNGPTGKCMLLFRKYCTRYEDIPQEIPEEAP